MQIIKDELKRIKLLMGNVWVILVVDPLHKVVFSFLCATFSLLIAEGMIDVIGKVAVYLGGIKYIYKTNMIEVAKSPVTVILFLLFLIIMTFCALFEIGGLLHSFSMAQVGRKTDMWGMKVFCWTVDDPKGIQYLVSCGVDVIGTDDPVMVNEKLDESDYSGGIKRYFHLLMKRIADMER